MASVSPEIKAAAYKTVDVFSSILGRSIYVREGSKSRITDYVIVTPFDDAHFYQRVEHGISHILFGSNALARDIFAFQYVEAIATQALKQAGLCIRISDLRDGISYIVGVLEAERVTSLWGQLYRGSEVLIRRYRREETKHLVKDAHRNVLHYLTVIATNHDNVPGGEIAWLEPTLREALDRVRFGTFRSTLTTTKWLVLQIIDHLVSIAKSEADNGSEPTVDERAAALDQLTKAVSSPPSSQKDKVNDFTESKYKAAGAENRAYDEAMQAINTPVDIDDAFDDCIADELEKMESFVEQIKERVIVKANQKDSLTTKDAKAKVLFVDLRADDMIDDMGYKIETEDRDSITRMRSFFFRVMGRRRNSLEDIGLEPDISAVIDRKVSHRVQPAFRTDSPGRGFKALLLLDRSASMHTEKILQCDKARKVLQQALSFPFVDIVTWGFNSPASGVIAVTRFGKDVPSLYAKGNLAKVSGGTPLHLAIQLAHQYLGRGSEKKHIFVLTDGAPMFWRWDGAPISATAVRRFVRREIDIARRKGIGVTTLLVQDRWGLPEGLDMSKLHKMLGPARTWRLLSQEDFGADLSKVVVASFMEYLRHG